MKKVLIVEDDRDLLNLCHLVLRQAGFETTTAHDAVHALIALENQQFDLVITDLNMPDQAGTAIIDTIHGNSRHTQTRILVITANDFMLPEVEARGIQNIMIKPFTIIELSKRVKAILE